MARSVDLFRDVDNTVTGFEGEAVHKVELDDMLMARNIGDDLHKHYPGHLWAVFVDSEGGVVNVFNRRISDTHGWRFMLTDLTPYDTGASKKVRDAGGEMLERADMLRGRADGQFAKKVDGTSDKGRKIIV